MVDWRRHDRNNHVYYTKDYVWETSKEFSILLNLEDLFSFSLG